MVARVDICKMINRILKGIPFIVLCAMVTACVTALPMKHEYKAREDFPVPKNEVWKLVSTFLLDSFYAINTVDQKSGYLKTEEFNVPYEGFQYKSEHADCGQLGGLHVYRKMIGYYEIFISSPDENSTVVRIVPYYRASLWSGNSFKGWVPCQSRGYVEKLLINDLWAKIEAAHPNLVRQPEKSAVKEPEDVSTPPVPIMEGNENETEKPDLRIQSETEPNDITIKYEHALQEIERLNNEVNRLKTETYSESHGKNQERSGLPDAEDLPDMHMPSENSEAIESVPDQDNKKDAMTVEPVGQDEDPALEFYTIQIGSFLEIDRAEREFNHIAELLQAKTYDNLRIEKIGEFYVVRIGKYDTFSSAEAIFRELVHKIDSPTVLKAYIKEERIIKLQDIPSL